MDKDPSIKDDYLEMKFNNRKYKEDVKIALGLGGGFLSLHSSFVC